VHLTKHNWIKAESVLFLSKTNHVCLEGWTKVVYGMKFMGIIVDDDHEGLCRKLVFK
jgi:hypothetical protein